MPPEADTVIEPVGVSQLDAGLPFALEIVAEAGAASTCVGHEAGQLPFASETRIG